LHNKGKILRAETSDSITKRREVDNDFESKKSYRMITVFYFAEIKERIGKDKDEFDVKEMTLEEIRIKVQQLYHLDIKAMFAVNLEYVSDLTTKVSSGDEVGIIPPVSGG
jgi:molybdopterin converting factor subunit 1